MKNIVMVSRFNATNARLYTLPDDVEIKAGTICTVEFGPDSTAVGVAVSDSYMVVGKDEGMIADLLHIIPKNLDTLKKVLSVYDEIPMQFESTTPETEDETDNA